MSVHCRCELCPTCGLWWGGRDHPEDGLAYCFSYEGEVHEWWAGIGPLPVRHARAASSIRRVDEYDAEVMTR